MSPKLQPGRFYGSILKSCEVNGFILSESLYSPDTKISQHSHAQSYLCMLLRGSYTERYDRKIRVCQPSTVVFHPSGEAHSNHFLKLGGRLFRLEIRQHWLDRVREYTNCLNVPADFNGGSLAWLSARLYEEFYRMDSLSPVVIEGLALEIMGNTARQSAPVSSEAPRWLSSAKDLIHERFLDDLSVAKIASFTGVHAVHLSRVFRRFYGCTVGEYIRRLRIEFASRQLSSSDTPLVDISAAAGFSDQSHFSKSFKLSTGMTPAKYRAFFRSR